MLTIFFCPKPFRGHINIIQRNAIRSWTLLKPRPEIILIGDEEGTAVIAKEFGLRHISETERNEYGTPLVSSIFNVAQAEATYPLMCYVNADIIFSNDFLQAIAKVNRYIHGQQFLLTGRRWNIKIEKYLDFNLPNWDLPLKNYVLSYGEIDNYGSIDYFVFPRGSFRDIPPFAIGRYRWDRWLLYKCRNLGMPLIDASSEIMAIHQSHDYSHASFNQKDKGVIIGPEVKKNLTLGKEAGSYTILNATHVLTSCGLNKQSFIHRLHGRLLRVYLFLYPFSYPLMLLFKLVKLVVRRLKMSWRKP